MSEFLIHENEAKTENISEVEGGAADPAYTLTVRPGKMFVVLELYLYASAAVVVTVKSGTTSIGTLTYAAAGAVDLKNAGVPVFRSRSAGDDFVLSVGGAVTLTGFVTYVLRDGRKVT